MSFELDEGRSPSSLLLSQSVSTSISVPIYLPSLAYTGKIPVRIIEPNDINPMLGEDCIDIIDIRHNSYGTADNTGGFNTEKTQTTLGRLSMSPQTVVSENQNPGGYLTRSPSDRVTLSSTTVGGASSGSEITTVTTSAASVFNSAYVMKIPLQSYSHSATGSNTGLATSRTLTHARVRVVVHSARGLCGGAGLPSPFCVTYAVDAHGKRLTAKDAVCVYALTHSHRIMIYPSAEKIVQLRVLVRR